MQREGEAVEPKEKKKKKKKKKSQAEKDARQRKWSSARVRLAAEAEEEMFKLDCETKSLFHTPLSSIQYADKPAIANLLALNLKKNMAMDKRDFYLFGFDTEGEFETAQIYANVDGVEHALLFQMSMIRKDGDFPPAFVELLCDPRIVFIGKNVEDEVVKFLRFFDFPAERINNVLFIEILDLIQCCDVFSRESCRDALRYVRDGVFFTDPLPLDEKIPDIFNDAGIRAAANYFLGAAIDKRVKHVHPKYTDWSRRVRGHPCNQKMSDAMKVYAVTDAHIAVECVVAAAKQLNVRPWDFARLARSDDSDAINPFVTDSLLLMAKDVKHERVSRDCRRLLDAARDNHDFKAIEESRRRQERHCRYVSKRDSWRKENGYDAITDDPFMTGGAFWSIFNTSPSITFTLPSTAGPSSSSIDIDPTPGVGAPLVSDAASFSSAVAAASPPTPGVLAPVVSDAAAAASTEELALPEIHPREVITEETSASDAIGTEAADPSPPSRRIITDSPVVSHPRSVSPISFPSATSTPAPTMRASQRDHSRNPWQKDIHFFTKATVVAALAEFDRMCMREDTDTFVEHVVFILSRLGKGPAKSLAIALTEHLPRRISWPLTIKIMHEKIVHASFLHTLDVLGLPLGGAVIFDQLLQGRDARHYLLEYLPMISSKEAQDFVDVASGLLDSGASAVRDTLRRHPLFHSQYAHDVNIDILFANHYIVDLIIRVCEFHSLELPQAAKTHRINKFFQHLLDEYKLHRVYPKDLILMIREALLRYKFEPEFAVDFFKERFCDLAECLAREFFLPPPSSSRAPDNLILIDPPCEVDHSNFASFMHNKRETYVMGENTLETFRKDIQYSQCLAIMHHEPPYLMPGAPRIDMLTVRTEKACYHLPTHLDSIFRTALNWIKCYNEDNTIYARNPQVATKYICDAYGWFPNFYDIRPHVDDLVRSESSSFTNIAQLLVNSECCFRGKVFSAHVRPSKAALHHRCLFVSLVYEFAVRHVGVHRVDALSQEEEQPQQPSPQPSPQRGRHVITYHRDAARDARRAAQDREREAVRRQRDEEVVRASTGSKRSLSSHSVWEPSDSLHSSRGQRARSPSIYREIEDAGGAGRPRSRPNPGAASVQTQPRSSSSSSRVKEDDPQTKRRRR